MSRFFGRSVRGSFKSLRRLFSIRRRRTGEEERSARKEETGKYLSTAAGRSFADGEVDDTDESSTRSVATFPAVTIKAHCICTDFQPKQPAASSCGDMMVNLPPDIKQRVAGYLSTKEAFRLARTSQQMKAGLNLKTQTLSPCRLLRNMGGSRWSYSEKFVQDIPTVTPSGKLHSIHVHCKWQWRGAFEPLLELCVLKQKANEHPLFPRTARRYNEFNSANIIAKCNVGYDGGENGQSDRELAMSFKPKTGGFGEQPNYQLWVRCTRGRGGLAPGIGQFVVLAVVHE